MSHVCIAVLLATTLVAPEATPAPASAVAPVEAPAPAPAPTTEPTPTTVVMPVGQPTAAAPVAEPAPEPAPTLQPAPAPAIEPVPPPPDPERVRQQRIANGLTVGGGTVLGLGAATLLLTTWPSYALYRGSLERAEEVRWVTQQQPFIDQAERRRTFMLTSAGIGVSLAAVGTVVLAMGLSRRARLRDSAAATLSVAPVVGGGHYGAGASLRF